MKTLTITIENIPDSYLNQAGNHNDSIIKPKI